MSTFGERLRSERERIGLSQEEFAKRCGVHRRSQVNYETDKRNPGEAYLDKLDDLGVDAAYVMTGDNKKPQYFYIEMQNELLVKLLGELGYSEYDAQISLRVFQEKLEEIAPKKEASTETVLWARQVAGHMFKDSKRIAMMIDEASELDSILLGDVLASVDAELQKQAAKVSNQKRGRIVASTYRSAKVQGKIDSKTLTDVVAISV